MRKVDPDGVKKSFDKQMTEVKDFYESIATILESEKDVTRLSALSLMSAATIWEGFLSDLVVAYINRNANNFFIHLDNALKSNMSKKQKEIQSRYAKFVTPRSIDRKTIALLLDGSGSNITFAKAQDLKDNAKIWITPENRRGIDGLSLQDEAIIDLIISLRNHIAHDSKRSRGRLKETVTAGALYGTGFHRPQNAVINPGAYLKSKDRLLEENSRIEAILERMRKIGAAI